MHPLINDLSELSDRELQDKLSKLNSYYFATASYNSQVQQQILLAIDTYQQELKDRLTRKSKDIDEDLDSLIKVS